MILPVKKQSKVERIAEGAGLGIAVRGSDKSLDDVMELEE